MCRNVQAYDLAMHDAIAVGSPLLAISAGVLFDRNDLKDLRTEVNARFNKIEGRLDRMKADLRQLYYLTGKLEVRMDALDKRG